MRFNRQQSIIILLITALLMVFTLFQASWLADKPIGKPKLIADHAADPVRDNSGCVASANSGYGGAAVGPDIAALQVAAGSGADAIRAVVVGARRTAEELGRAFPGIPVITSAGDAVHTEIGTGPALVVATPGAEPHAPDGYGAALLLDSWSMLGRQDLRAAEDTLVLARGDLTDTLPDPRLRQDAA